MLNGVNTVMDAHGHQTKAITTAWSGKHWGWSQIYMDGNEKISGSGRRHLSDTILTFSPSRAITAYIEGIAAVEKRVNPGYDHWYGWATARKISTQEKWSLSPRLEWLNDMDGATTGTYQHLKEFTITGEYRPRKFLISRLEYRDGWSNQPFYARTGNLPSARRQQVVLIGLTYLFHHDF